MTATITPTATSTPTSTATATTTATSTPTSTATAAPTSTPQSGPPRFALSATRGTVDYRLGILITGYPARTSVRIYFAGKEIASVMTDSDGTASISFPIPAKPKGTYAVRAAAGSKSVSQNFEIVPRIKLIPGSGARGATINVSLRGYAAGERVRIRWLVNGRWSEITVVAKTSSTGSANVNIQVPATAVIGLASVRGDGTIGRAETNIFRVT